MATFESLLNDRYISIETFRPDGSSAKTPVWFATENGALLVYTDDTSFKVKRLLKNPRARVATCDMRGNVKGPWFDATAEVIPNGDPRAKDVYAKIGKKYGWQYALIAFFSKFFTDRRCAIVIKPV